MSIYFEVTENWDPPRLDTVYPSYQTSAYIRLLGITNLVNSVFFLLSLVLPLKINANLAAARISITADDMTTLEVITIYGFHSDDAIRR